jgi:hypothetical protein
MLWYAGYESPDPWLKPGTIMFYLTFKPKRGIAEKGNQLALNDAIFSNLAWAPDGKEFHLVASEPATREREALLPTSHPFSVDASPNPTSGNLRLVIRSDKPVQARVAVFSAFGQMLWMQQIELTDGESILETGVLADKPAGVYLWKVWTPSGVKVEGHIVKQ